MAEQTKTNSYYIGIMSGTSLDGVDIALVEFNNSDDSLALISSHYQAIETELQQQLLSISNPNWLGSLSEVGMLHQQLGKLFATSVNTLLRKSKIQPNQIIAIGSHGQTVRHQPSGEHPFSMQLGDANQISEITGITTVADFRNRDIAAGGQGAPLVPAFHQEIFTHPSKNRVILNIGGIANITLLPSSSSNQHSREGKSISGFDTGPGNGLMDSWISQHKNKRYDQNGDWARSGEIIEAVLNKLLSEPYFSAPIPKSTGKEMFNLAWLKGMLNSDISTYKPEDIQATITELSAVSIANSIKHSNYNMIYEECLVCGGGAQNHFLMERLQTHLPDMSIDTTQTQGIDPDWVEAIAFAWLAKQNIEGKAGNLPSATGAKGFRVLGAIYPK